MIVLKEKEAVYKAIDDILYQSFRDLIYFDNEEELPKEVYDSYYNFRLYPIEKIGITIIACYSKETEYAIEDENGEIEFDGKRYKKI